MLHPTGTEWHRKGTRLLVARETYPWTISGRYSVQTVMRNKVLHKSILAGQRWPLLRKVAVLINRGYIVGSLHSHFQRDPKWVSYIEALDLTGLTAVLSDRLDILTQGRRTALPRHQSLRANFEWSYALLPECERDVLCSLANFTHDFTLDSAVTMLEGKNLAPGLVVEAIVNLVAKSLIWAERQRSEISYRLPLGVRAYALEKFSTRRGGETSESPSSCTALR